MTDLGRFRRAADVGRVSGLVRVGVALLACSRVFAAPPARPEPRFSVDAALGAKQDAGRIGVGAWYAAFRPGHRWDLGVGVRASSHFGSASAFTARGSTGPAAPAEISIDPSTYALNVAVFGEFRVSPRIALGANLDLIGAATGPTRAQAAGKAKPESFSYFAYGTKDHGSLDSEFYISVRLDERIRLRAGFSHYVTNYVPTEPASSDVRYQRFDTVPFVAVGWRLGSGGRTIPSSVPSSQASRADSAR